MARRSPRPAGPSARDHLYSRGPQGHRRPKTRIDVRIQRRHRRHDRKDRNGTTLDSLPSWSTETEPSSAELQSSSAVREVASSRPARPGGSRRGQRGRARGYQAICDLSTQSARRSIAPDASALVARTIGSHGSAPWPRFATTSDVVPTTQNVLSTNSPRNSGRRPVRSSGKCWSASRRKKRLTPRRINDWSPCSGPNKSQSACASSLSTP